MPTLLDHFGFRKFAFDALPVGRDLFLMDEQWLPEWEVEWIKCFGGQDAEPYGVGFISWASITCIDGDRAELQWMANTHTRFHAIRTILPREAFVVCAQAFEYEKRPTVFVKREWLDDLHARAHSTFAMIDASGFTAALTSGLITKASLRTLRDRIDGLADVTPQVSFTSFADSLLLKTNWVVGSWDKPSTTEYDPEKFIRLIGEIDEAYRDVLGLGTYAVVSQGSNEYYDDALVHTSAKGNHVSLNSLGLPFAQISAIESAARSGIRKSAHPPAELYLDRDFFLSLGVDDYEWRMALPTYEYDQKLSSESGRYICVSRGELLQHLR